MQIVRTEPNTGGPSRTKREQIEPVFNSTDEVEPDALIDASSSEGFEGSSSSEDGAPTTWTVQKEAFRQFIVAAEQLDSQAKGEQAGGSDEMGGLYTAFFNQDLIKVGEGDDDGDLNSSNYDRKVDAIRVRDEFGKWTPLPYGGTNITPAARYLDQHYLGEFSKRKDGSPRPVSERPKRARLVMTDGAMNDFREFGTRLEEDHSNEWPQEEWFIVVLGHGTAHDDTLTLYGKLAEKHTNIHLYSFDSVTNPAEIAEDMAIAVLATK